MNNFINYFSTIGFKDVFDILFVAILIYMILKMITGTRAEQLSKGILVILILTKASQILQFHTINWILSNLLTVGLLAILIVFQPELRRGLEFIGRTSSIRSNFSNEKKTPSNVVEIVDAVASLSRQKIGALIIIERQTGLNEIIETGTTIDAILSSGLLINIFIPNTPLHDGAVILKKDRIVAAGCFLPLTDNEGLSKELGTRHRAGIGITEKSDCLAVIVSEETGTISIAEYGVISRYLDIETLESILMDIYSPQGDNNSSVLGKWRNK